MKDCTDCEHFSVNNLMCDLTNKKLTDLEPCDNISVVEFELPEINEIVLVYIGLRKIPFVGTIDINGYWYYYDVIEDKWLQLPLAFKVLKWKKI